MEEFIKNYKSFNNIFLFKQINLKNNSYKNNLKMVKAADVYNYKYFPYKYLLEGEDVVVDVVEVGKVKYYDIIFGYSYLVSNSLLRKGYGYYGDGFNDFRGVVEDERLKEGYKGDVFYVDVGNMGEEKLYTTYFIYKGEKDEKHLMKVVDMTEEGGNLVVEMGGEMGELVGNMDEMVLLFEDVVFLFSAVDLRIKMIFVSRCMVGNKKKVDNFRKCYVSVCNYYNEMLNGLESLNRLGLEMENRLDKNSKRKVYYEKQVKMIQMGKAMDFVIKYGLLVNKKYLSENEEVGDVEVNKFKNKLSYFFPKSVKIDGKIVKPDLSKIKLSPESIYSITPYGEAVDTVYLIAHFLKKPVVFLKEMTITDGTTNVGGNMIAFCEYFKFVNGVEIKSHHVEFLRNNLDLFGFSNYKLIEGDITEKFEVLKQDILFLDPPWGGVLYKYYPEVGLYLSGMEVGELISKLPKETRYVGLKAPFNYKINNIQKNVDYKRMVIYNLRRYIIIMIERS